LFSETNYGHSFCNEQRFEDLKDFEPTDDKDFTRSAFLLWQASPVVAERPLGSTKNLLRAVLRNYYEPLLLWKLRPKL